MTVRVGIDLTALLPMETGVDVYLRNLVQALSQVDSGRHYTIFVNIEDMSRISTGLGINFRVVGRCLRPRPVRLLFQQAALPVLATYHGLDVLHSPSFIMPMVKGSQRHLLTVYDMTSFSHPQYHIALRGSSAYQWAVRRSLQRADLITVPSDSTRSEILRFLPDMSNDRIRVVPPGIDRIFRPHSAREMQPVLERLRLERPYILYVGTIEPRKNLVRLVQAYDFLVRKYGIHETLVLAGRLGWGSRPLFETIASLGIKHRARFLDYVDAEELPRIFCGARLFVYPSIHEGFGFPPLEAMACGVPTVATRTSALAENLEGVVELVPPEDIGALASAMLRLLTDEALRVDRRQQGLERAGHFSWRRTAESTAEIYGELFRMSGKRRHWR